MEDRLRRTVRIVALLNLDYFGVEFAVARAIGSVFLFADSIDFLEDASINFLIFAALGWSLALRSRVGMATAAIILIPSLATHWTAWDKVLVPVPSAPVPLSLAGAGAFAVNLTCAHQKNEGHRLESNFLSRFVDASAISTRKSDHTYLSRGRVSTAVGVAPRRETTSR